MCEERSSVHLTKFWEDRLFEADLSNLTKTAQNWKTD
jgi:hypothetical protein